MADGRERVTGDGSGQGLGARVRAYRTERGYTFSELARRSGISRSYLYQVESGASSPTGEKMRALAAALDVSVQDLLDGAAGPDSDVPATLQAFARQAQLPPADVAMLAGIRYRGKQPATAEGWRMLYAILRSFDPSE